MSLSLLTGEIVTATSSITSLPSQNYQVNLTGLEKHDKFKGIVLLANQVGYSTFNDTFSFSTYGRIFTVSKNVQSQVLVLQNRYQPSSNSASSSYECYKYRLYVAANYYLFSVCMCYVYFSKIEHQQSNLGVCAACDRSLT